MAPAILTRKRRSNSTKSRTGQDKIRVIETSLGSSVTANGQPYGKLRRQGSRLLSALRLSKGYRAPLSESHEPMVDVRGFCVPVSQLDGPSRDADAKARLPPDSSVCPGISTVSQHELVERNFSPSSRNDTLTRSSSMSSRIRAFQQKIQKFNGTQKVTPPTLLPVSPGLGCDQSPPAVRTASSKHGSLRVMRSSPALTNRFSDAFQLHTVVHRPNKANRPSVLPSGDMSLDELGSLEVMAGIADFLKPGYSRSSSVTYVNSVGSSSGPPSSTSTVVYTPYNYSQSFPSSLTPIGARAPYPSMIPIREQGRLPSIAEARRPRSLLLPIQGYDDVIQPSVKTIEKSAAAKVFFELHFDALYADVTPRILRRKVLEDQLCSIQTMMLSEERQNARKRWARAESDHLRQLRNLKSKSLVRTGTKGISVAGYEHVRILGKGSFGIVRLVREMKHRFDSSSSGDPLEVPVSSVDGPSESRSPNRRNRDLSQLNREVFAMKVIRKADMLRNSQEAHLRAERDFLVQSTNSKWVVPLIASFQDNSHLYLVMEYMVGGDFLGLLLREDVLDEPVAAWYIAEMILCVEETHKMHWIHRDVKPDNFLISPSGHLKISDFGLAFDGHWAHNQSYYTEKRATLFEKYGIDIIGDQQDRQADEAAGVSRRVADVVNGGKKPRPRANTNNSSELVIDKLNHTSKRLLANSVVGTSQYMAPEVIRGDKYDGRCDWWSIGIILYECLYGSTPFFCEDRAKTKARILDHHQSLHFPCHSRVARPYSDPQSLPPVSGAAKELILWLLRDKETRLSDARYRVNDCRSSRRGTRQRHSPGTNQNYVGYFVYPNDAEVIKAQPFFKWVDWEDIHRQRPPFVPRVQSNQPITKYFEDEHDILSGGDDPNDDADSSSDDGSDKENVETSTAPLIPGLEDGPADSNPRPKKPKKEKKRPRDKILRDARFSKDVMDVRKKQAFLGYTYRRPKIVGPGEQVNGVWDEERGGRQRTRSSLYVLPGVQGDAAPSEGGKAGNWWSKNGVENPACER